MNQDQAFKMIDVILAQSNDLWSISVGLFIAAGLIVVRLLNSPSTESKGAFCWLAASMALNIAALVAGFMVKGALVGELSTVRSGGVWSFSDTAEWWSLVQLLLLISVGVTFILAFLWHRGVVSSAASKTWGGE